MAKVSSFQPQKQNSQVDKKSENCVIVKTTYRGKRSRPRCAMQPIFLRVWESFGYTRTAFFQGKNEAEIPLFPPLFSFFALISFFGYLWSRTPTTSDHGRFGTWPMEKLERFLSRTENECRVVEFVIWPRRMGYLTGKWPLPQVGWNNGWKVRLRRLRSLPRFGGVVFGGDRSRRVEFTPASQEERKNRIKSSDVRARLGLKTPA